MVAIQHDGIIAALHVFDHGIKAVTIGQIGTDGTCVGAIDAQAVGPTVIHGKAIIGGDGSGWSQLDRRGSCWQQFGSGNCGGIGAVKTSLTGHEFVEEFLFLVVK